MVDKYNNTPLMLATFSNQPQVVQILLNHPNMTQEAIHMQNDTQQSALHLSCEYNCLECVKLLLSDPRTNNMIVCDIA